MTVVGGRVVHGAGDFAPLDDNPLPPAMPEWSPTRSFKGYGAWGEPDRAGGTRCIRRATGWRVLAPAPADCTGMSTRVSGPERPRSGRQGLFGRPGLLLLRVRDLRDAAGGPATLDQLGALRRRLKAPPWSSERRSPPARPEAELGRRRTGDRGGAPPGQARRRGRLRGRNAGVHAFRARVSRQSRHSRVAVRCRRFAANTPSWIASPISPRGATSRKKTEYREWMRRLRELTEGEPYIEELGGLAGWFTPPGGPRIAPPAKIKMALVTFVGVYPLTALLPAFLHAAPARLASAARQRGHHRNASWRPSRGWSGPLLVRALWPWLYRTIETTDREHA